MRTLAFARGTSGLCGRRYCVVESRLVERLSKHIHLSRAATGRRCICIANSRRSPTRAWNAGTARDRAHDAATLTYPVVLKAGNSEEFSGGKVRATGAPLYARNSREFAAAYDEMSRRSDSVLAQQYVEGEGAGYFALMREGELRAEFAHRRI